MAKIIELDLDKHFDFLYILLEERYSVDYINMSDSLQELPSRSEYLKHLQYTEMEAWIIQDEDYIAFLFVRAGEVGVFIKREYQGMGYGTLACRFIYDNFDNVYAKCNIKNIKSLSLIKKFLKKDGDIWRK